MSKKNLLELLKFCCSLKFQVEVVWWFSVILIAVRYDLIALILAACLQTAVMMHSSITAMEVIDEMLVGRVKILPPEEREPFYVVEE